MEFDYVKFINEGYDSQQKYAEKADEYGPRQFQQLDYLVEAGLGAGTSAIEADMLPKRYAKIIEHFGHLIEESIEARVYVPRRSWKNGERSYLDSPELRKEFVAELYDILLFHRAILAYAGVTGEEFAEIAAEKQAYNKVRKDHNVNGNEVVTALPNEELAGNCASAGFANNNYDRD
jgi:hypothetical protein